MFGFAIWDARRRRLLLARDRAGIKPLYYAATDDGLVFASEPKTILASGLVEARLRADSLPDYFMFRAPVHPHSLVEGLRKLGPGERLLYEPGKAVGEPSSYWSFDETAERPGGVEAAESAVLDTLDGAVESHLAADVPVGVFLSGGVDSSLVAALIARRERLDAFTIGSDSPLDESRYARTVADHLDQRIHVRMATPADFLDRFDRWAYYNDDPVADPSALALMVLAEHARSNGMTVMLAGEGADELFGGYNSYQRYAFYRKLAAIPLAGVWGSLLAKRVGGKDGDYLRTLDDPRFFGHAHLTDRSTRRRLFEPAVADRLEAWEATAFEASVAHPEPLREAMLFDQAVRLPSDVLSRTDRATMAASLEARVPFLDRAVIELANALPGRWCVRQLPRFQGKWLLKRVAAREVPSSVVYRPKLGFELPMDEWLRTDFRDRIHGLLDERAIPELDYGYLREAYANPGAWKKRWAALIWAWLVLERWHRLWIGGGAEPVRPTVVADEASYRLLRDAWERGGRETAGTVSVVENAGDGAAADAGSSEVQP
jgi:asparagine synthase (glutamine-hydrolysing)